MEFVPNELNAGQEDLRGTGTQGHQSQVGHSVIPDLDLNFLVALIGLHAGDLDDPCSAGDLLNGAHEDVCNDGHAQEAPEQAGEIEECPRPLVPCVLAEEGQDKPLVRAEVIIEVDGAVVSHLGYCFTEWWACS